MPLFRFKPEFRFFVLIRFFPGRPFIKRPEEKKRKRKFFYYFFCLSLESGDVRQHAVRAAVISVALISRLIPRTPADYVYVCNERTMNLVRLRTYVCCSGKRSYHTQPWNQVYDFMRRWFSDRSLHIKYSYITRRVPTKSLSHGHLRLGRTSCLTHVHVCWSDKHWNLVFVNSVKAWSGGRVRPILFGTIQRWKNSRLCKERTV